MLKSILSMFGSLGGMILRFMLAIGLVVLFCWCIFTVFHVPFLWGGFFRVLGILASGVGFIWLVGAFKKPEEDGGADDERRA